MIIKTNLNNYVELLDFLCKDMDGELHVLTNEKLLDRFSTDEIELEALSTKSPIADTYIVYVREDVSEKILCHEIIHIKQFISGDLDYNLAENTYFWKGKVYQSNEISYFSRPWEKEAFDQQGDLLAKWKEYKKEKYPKKKCKLVEKLFGK